MSKELEEAKKQCEHIIKFYTDLDTIHSSKNKCFEIRAIETILNYIDNSIPKEVIEKKIEELNENGYWDYLEERDLEKTKNILQELLEGK